jgi:hypothetical protein
MHRPLAARHELNRSVVDRGAQGSILFHAESACDNASPIHGNRQRIVNRDRLDLDMGIAGERRSRSHDNVPAYDVHNERLRELWLLR